MMSHRPPRITTTNVLIHRSLACMIPSGVVYVLTRLVTVATATSGIAKRTSISSIVSVTPFKKVVWTSCTPRARAFARPSGKCGSSLRSRTRSHHLRTHDRKRCRRLRRPVAPRSRCLHCERTLAHRETDTSCWEIVPSLSRLFAPSWGIVPHSCCYPVRAGRPPPVAAVAAPLAGARKWTPDPIPAGSRNMPFSTSIPSNGSSSSRSNSPSSQA